MFNIQLDYPTYEEELQVVKNTTSDRKTSVGKVLHAAEIQAYQQLVRRVPVADNVVEYAVSLVHKPALTPAAPPPASTSYWSGARPPRLPAPDCGRQVQRPTQR